jgi:hypothetical protein
VKGYSSVSLSKFENSCLIPNRQLYRLHTSGKLEMASRKAALDVSAVPLSSLQESDVLSPLQVKAFLMIQ